MALETSGHIVSIKSFLLLHHGEIKSEVGSLLAVKLDEKSARQKMKKVPSMKLDLVYVEQHKVT